MSRYRIEAIAKRRVLGYWLVAIGLTVGYVMMRGSGWQGSTQLHTLMEGIATLLASIVGAMSLVRFYSKKNNTFLFIGTGFLGTALLDGYHAAVTSAFFASYLPSELSSLIPWSWVASRLFLSVLLCLSWLAWIREQRLGEAGRISERSVYLVAGGLTLASFLFFAFVPLTRGYYPEFVFHRPEEFVPALLFMVALVGYLRKGKWRDDAFEHWLVLALIVGFVSQAVFMSFSGQLFDMEFDAAHLLKKVSYVCVLTGLLISMHSIFRRAEKDRSSLAQEVEERKRIEIELRRYAENANNAAEKLARSNAELEQFAYVASHDLQEPLRKVQAFSDRLRNKYETALDEQGIDYLARMHAAAGRMQKLVNDLLAYSRVATKGEDFIPVALDSVVHEVVGDLEIRIEETGARIEVADMPTIDAAPLQMRQLLQNLIANALKYQRKDVPPFIKIAGEVVEIGSIGPNGTSTKTCRIVVEDNGVGFEAQFAERIFGIFQRLHGRGEYEGTGVGLAICRKIAERHDGTISARSRPGVGSTFTVTLPLQHQSPEQPRNEQ